MIFKTNKDSVFYIIAPAYYKTGGTELAHQLVYEMQNNGLNSTIAYYGIMDSDPINPEFKEYVKGFVSVDDILDQENNVVIIPEVMYHYVTKFKHIQKAVWWMSVDNYLKNDGIKNYYYTWGWYKCLKSFLLRRITINNRDISKDDVVHLYQSYYALDYLKSKGVNKMYRLSDYINQIYVDEKYDPSIKENIVLYNPKKGFEFTKKIIVKSEMINWIAIENLSTSEVRDLLLKSKVYVDFGNHPGKDRFPREAAASGCCVLTGKKGSAKYYKDIPIPEEYKFEDVEENIPLIIKKIECCLQDYENKIIDFDEYRKKIYRERSIFTDDVYYIFGSNEVDAR